MFKINFIWSLFLFALAGAEITKSGLSNTDLTINGTDIFEYIQSNKQRLRGSCKSEEGSNIREKAVMVVGLSGTGKSTLVNYLSGVKLVSNKLKSKWVVEIDPASKRLPCGFEIGHQTSAKTVYPSVYSPPGSDYSFIDNPGFQDTRGLAREIANGFFIEDVTRRVSQLKFLLLIEQNDLFGRASQFRQSISAVTSFLQLKKYAEGSMIKQISRSMGIVVTKGINTGETYESVVESCIEKMNEALMEEQEHNGLDDETVSLFVQIFENNQVGVFSGRRTAGQLDDEEKNKILELVVNGLDYVEKSDINIGINIGASFAFSLSNYIEKKFQEFDAHVSNMTIEAFTEVFNSNESLTTERANELKELHKTVNKIASPSINTTNTIYLLERMRATSKASLNMTKVQSSWEMFDYFVSLLSEESKRILKKSRHFLPVTSQFNNRLAIYLRLNLNSLFDKIETELNEYFRNICSEDSLDQLIQSHQKFNKIIISAGQKLDINAVKSLCGEVKLKQEFEEQVVVTDLVIDYFLKVLPEENQLLLKTNYDAERLTNSINIEVSLYLKKLIDTAADRCRDKSYAWLDRVLMYQNNSILLDQQYETIKNLDQVLKQMKDESNWCLNLTDHMISKLQEQYQETVDQELESLIKNKRRAFNYCTRSVNAWCQIKLPNQSDLEILLKRFNNKLTELIDVELTKQETELRAEIFKSLEEQLSFIADEPINGDEARQRFKYNTEYDSFNLVGLQLVEKYVELLDEESEQAFIKQKEIKRAETLNRTVEYIDLIAKELDKLNNSVNEVKENMFIYKGHYGKLSSVLAELNGDQGITNLTLIRIVASQRFEIDVDFQVDKQMYEFNAPHLVIASPKVIIAGEVKIDLSCDHAPSYLENTSLQRDGTRAGESGRDGKPGLPGCNGGSLFIVSDRIEGQSMLEFVSTGGKGGPGEDGGNGVDGSNGQHSIEKWRYRLPDPVYRLDRSDKFRDVYGRTDFWVVKEYEKFIRRDAVCLNYGRWSDEDDKRRARVHDYLKHHGHFEEYQEVCEETNMGMRNDEYYVLRFEGDPGSPGGNGGRGGTGGRGGSNGKAVFIRAEKSVQSVESIFENTQPSDGANGKPGLPGKGGRDGNTTQLVYAYFRPKLAYNFIPVFGQFIEFNLFGLGTRYCLLKDKIDSFNYQPNGIAPQELNRNGLRLPTASNNSMKIVQEGVSDFRSWVTTSMESFEAIKSLFTSSLVNLTVFNFIF